MAPVVANDNARAYIYIAACVVVTSSLVALIVRNSIYEPYKALPPSQDTRWRRSNRRKNILIFSGLAILSLVQSCFHFTTTLILLYKVWAHEMGLSRGLWYTRDQNELMLGKWLESTSPFTEVWEIAVESSTRYWWTHQLFLSGAAWAVYVGFEGRRRNIPHLWAFLLLVPLVSRAFAMNLFFLAVLCTPVPQASSLRKRRSFFILALDDGWMRHLPAWVPGIARRVEPFLPHNPFATPPRAWHPYAWSINLQNACLFISVFLLPYTTSTEWFSTSVIINLAVLFRHAYPANLGSPINGTTTWTAHGLRHNYLKANRFLAGASLLLFAKQTFVALLDSDPGAHRHRHSEYLEKLNLPHQPHRSHLSRSGKALSGILSAAHDHPAVTRMAYDVLLSALTLIVWATIRGLDVKRMLSVFGFTSPPPTKGSSMSVSSLSSTDTSKPKRSRSRKSSTAPNLSSPSAPATSKTGNATSGKTLSKALTVWQGEEELNESGESGAVAGVAFALGGLGVLSSMVFAAEEI